MLARNKNIHLYMKQKRMATRFEDIERMKAKENRKFDFAFFTIIVLSACIVVYKTYF